MIACILSFALVAHLRVTLLDPMSSEQAHTEEIIDAARDPEHTPEGSDDEVSGDEAPPDEQATEGVPLASTSSKKKKKKKTSKAVRALNALRGKSEIPQEVVDQVLDKVKAHGGVEGADAETVRAALEQMKIMEVMKGKTGIGGKNKKDMGEHKVCLRHLKWYLTCSYECLQFWATQPVQQMGRCTISQ